MNAVIALLVAILAVLLGAGAFTAILTGTAVMLVSSIAHYVYARLVEETTYWR